MVEEQRARLPAINVANELKHFKNFLTYRLKGQPRAIESAVKVYEYDLTFRKLEQRKSVVGSLLLLGPSGVGKTELARLIAEFFVGDKKGLIKIPCELFSQSHAVHTIIGAPPGYVGYDKPPMLSREYIDEKLGLVKANKDFSKNVRKTKTLSMTEALGVEAEKVLEKIGTYDALIECIEKYRRFLYEPVSLEDGVQASLKNLINSPNPRFKVDPSSEDSEIFQTLMVDLENPGILLTTLATLYSSKMAFIRIYFEIVHKINEVKQRKMINNATNKLVSNQAQGAAQDRLQRIVLLFDEIEKGNTTLHNLLLQIMEDGEVTLANGKVTNLEDAIVVMTSNVGAREFKKAIENKSIGFSGSSSGENDKVFGSDNVTSVEKKIIAVAERELGKTFSPEFRGRIDEVVIFRVLDQESFIEIFNLQLKEFNIMLSRSGVVLEVDEDVRNFVVKSSLHRPDVGCRLLSHKFKSLIKRPLGRVLTEKSNFKGIIKTKLIEEGVEFVFNHNFDQAP